MDIGLGVISLTLEISYLMKFTLNFEKNLEAGQK
jgi:hypothetical protein